MKDLKDLQLEIVNKYNPAKSENLTWIRDKSDIMTFKEAIASEGLCGDDTYTEDDVEKAFQTGKITIYSSYPIEQGIFVTPSKMQAQDYAGPNGKVYSKTVELDKVAWIDSSQGQYADIEMEKEKKLPSLDDILSVAEDKAASQNVDFKQTKKLNHLEI